VFSVDLLSIQTNVVAVGRDARYVAGSRDAAVAQQEELHPGVFENAQRPTQGVGVVGTCLHKAASSSKISANSSAEQPGRSRDPAVGEPECKVGVRVLAGRWRYQDTLVVLAEVVAIFGAVLLYPMAGVLEVGHGTL